jgi:DNA-binding LacI/PurR family transcriptional regulator
MGLRHRGLPVVLVDNHVPGTDLPAVVPDYRAGARLATAHLVRLGHRRIALLGAEVSYPFGAKTFEGYREALATGAIAQDPALVQRTEIGVEAATEATLALLALPSPPTALFAVTDAMAIGALRAARERGLRVPEELAVVGMDDIELSAYTDPPLTTVRIEKEAMGRLAADWLIALIEGTAAAHAVAEVPIQLIVRGTCGGATAPTPRATEVT